MPVRADRLLHHVRHVVSRAATHSDDAALLSAFVSGRDPAAFAALVARHGPMVLRICRRVLGHAQDAEDAFQATFLVLARKAAGIRPASALAAWLHGVACRVALGARTANTRRRRRENPGPGLTPTDPRPDPLAELTARETLELLDEEVQRLPRVYRLPVLLCCLEGLSQEEAARRLGWSPGSVKGRLERGRKRLHQELTQRGLGLATALGVVEISRGAAVGLPAVLAASTVRAAAAFAAGGSAGVGPVSAEVAALVEAGMKPLALARAKVRLLLLLLATATATGAGLFAHPAPARVQPAAQAQAAEQDKGTRAEVPRADRPAGTDRHGDPLPEGAVARLGTTRLRAAGAQLGLSPDGKTITSVANGRQIKFWDAETGKLRGQRELPDGPSNGAILSPDGRTLAIEQPGPDPSLDIWDVLSAKRLRQLRFGQKWAIYRAAFSADGKRLAAVEWGGEIYLHLFDIQSGDSRLLKGNKTVPLSLAFSADGKLLATAENGYVTCWQAGKDKPLWQAPAHTQALAFTPDGRVLIASPGFKGPSWYCWEAATGKPAEGVKLPQGYAYAHLAVAPDSRTLVFAQPLGVAGADHRVRLWGLRLGTLLRTLPVTGDIGPFAPDGRSFLTNNGTLQRWELTTGRPLLPDTDALGHRANVLGVAYSPDGRLLASTADDGTIRLWDLTTAKPLHVLRGHERWASGLAFTPDGKRLVSGSVESELRVWDVNAGGEVRRIPLHNVRLGEKKQHVWRLHVTPDGQTVVVLGYDPEEGGAVLPHGILTRWELASGRRITFARSAGPSNGSNSALAPDGQCLACGGLLLDTTTYETRARLEGAPQHLGQYAFSPDGRLVAGLAMRYELDAARSTLKMDGIQVWDSASGAAVRRIRTDNVGQPVFSPDGRYLAAAGLDSVRLWEVTTGQLVLRHKARELVHGANALSFASCLAFAPGGRTLATGHPDSTVLIWSVVPPGRPALAADLPGLWKDLIGPDAAAAYAASWRLTEAPGEALPLLRKHLRPVKPAPVEETRPLLADLDSDDFHRREAASERLRALGDRAGEALRQAFKAAPSPEKRRRVEALLKVLEEPPSGEALAELRAAAVLERLGTADARDLLKELAAGDPQARLTREAMASLERLAGRPAKP